MSDWSHEEYKAILTNQVMPESEKNYEEVAFDLNAVANAVDWRTSGAV